MLCALSSERQACAAIDPNEPAPFTETPGEQSFPLAVAGQAAPLLVAADEYPGVLRVAEHVRADLERVAGSAPPVLRVVNSQTALPAQAVLAGTLGKSSLVERLVAAGKFDPSDLRGRREKFVATIVDAPLPGMTQALVIVGSDKRGTIYGLYDLADRSGVSPWAWWADVPTPRRPDMHVPPERRTVGEPAVEFRGIFINDEAPALSGWAHATFGACNSRFYDKVFELILRLRGNYLWPAMWGRSLFDDDPESARLADEYGVVLGTSHHEPMMRAHVEWQRYGQGPWNYEKNAETLREFWAEGLRRRGEFESIVTIGMRGDGDEPMTEQTNIALLERIVADQRAIIAQITGRDPTETPQCWALYKEVQEYYDRGMRVPDDVLLLLCDDNWGNIRKLPALGAPPRPGGYGVYYHFDYVGGPRNYKWINTNPLPRIWEQMHLARRYGANRLWVVNVGDIKPMEFPIEFFLDYAWNPEAWPSDRLGEYGRRWAARQFGESHAAAIADLLAKYAKFNARRKPELLSPDTYSLVDFDEADARVAEYGALATSARRIEGELPVDARDAFFQLVLHPVEASANLNELYVVAGKNRLYAEHRRRETNDLAARVAELFERDAAISRRYNEETAGGKWRHMMDQTHIGYTSWQEPPRNEPPATRTIDVPSGTSWGVAIEGSRSAWPAAAPATLPELNEYGPGERWIEVFARGTEPVKFAVICRDPWLRVSPARGATAGTQRIAVAADWRQFPPGTSEAILTVRGPADESVEIRVPVVRTDVPPTFQGHVEAAGYVSIEAEHASRRVDGPNVRWHVIPDLGRTLSGVTIMPPDVPRQLLAEDSPRLEYRVLLTHSGSVAVRVFAAPTQDFAAAGGLQYAVSFDDQPPQLVNMHADASNRAWERQVAENVNETTTEHRLEQAGEHVLKFWLVDPGIVLQKLVVARGELPASYLGPPESVRVGEPASPAAAR
ncbi:MAG: glycosyl hydrolase 115 family protein [Pirellulales bacterium]|nr:glycosyl hydrolase 115 family protein [Pirellulales bacterium]